MTRPQHIESGTALVFAGVFLLVVWQPQLQWLLWPAVALFAGATYYALYKLPAAERARRARAAWVTPLTFLVLAGIFAWLAPGLSRVRSFQLAGVLIAMGVALTWAKRRLT
jgi:hypothetical protein